MSTMGVLVENRLCSVVDSGQGLSRQDWVRALIAEQNGNFSHFVPFWWN